MYFLFTDETNLRPSRYAEFFIYGGIFVPADQLADLDALVTSARNEHGFLPEDEFKFATASRPGHVTTDQFRQAKQAVLQGCPHLHIRFAVSVTLHKIARRRPDKELVGWGANTVIGGFNKFLDEEKADGVCIVDRLPFRGDYQYLQKKFQVGLTLPNGTTRHLDHILLFASSCLGASHAASATDIVLGAFRYCVNERRQTEVTHQMFPVIAGMMWHQRIGDTLYLRERGLVFRPKNVKVAEYQAAYEELTQHLKGLIASKGHSD